MSKETILNVLIAHFKSVIEASAGVPFEQTGVTVPVKSFEGYAEALYGALYS